MGNKQAKILPRPPSRKNIRSCQHHSGWRLRPKSKCCYDLETFRLSQNPTTPCNIQKRLSDRKSRLCRSFPQHLLLPEKTKQKCGYLVEKNSCKQVVGHAKTNLSYEAFLCCPYSSRLRRGSYLKKASIG
eukprot:Lithocolla_globosa_v1_NODE_2521_length_1965_cov_23.448168.p3 type:complete len:130 gc:universal NODE_2521_length_1965_cov_23.448168:1001-612(-)